MWWPAQFLVMIIRKNTVGASGMCISFSLYLVIWWAGVYEIKSKLAGDMGFLALSPSLAVFYRIFSVCNDVKCYIFLMHNSSTLFIGIVFLFYKTHELKNGTWMSATRNSRFWTLYRRMAHISFDYSMPIPFRYRLIITILCMSFSLSSPLMYTTV